MLLSAFAGWFISFILIKALFYPLNPIKIAGFTIQGIIPARQNIIAGFVGKLVSKELANFGNLEEKISNPENFNKLKPKIETEIDSFLRVRLKDTFPMLGMFIGDKTINQLKGAFMQELESLFPVLMNGYITNLKNDFDVEKEVKEKMVAVSMEKTAHEFYSKGKKHLHKIEVTAAFIGLMIGALQVLLNILLYP